MLAIALQSVIYTLFAGFVIIDCAVKVRRKFAEIRAELKACPETREVRFTVREFRMPPPTSGKVHILPIRRLVRHPLRPADLRAAA
jgi:hypothetical protein